MAMCVQDQTKLKNWIRDQIKAEAGFSMFRKKMGKSYYSDYEMGKLSVPKLLEAWQAVSLFPEACTLLKDKINQGEKSQLMKLQEPDFYNTYSMSTFIRQLSSISKAEEKNIHNVKDDEIFVLFGQRIEWRANRLWINWKDAFRKPENFRLEKKLPEGKTHYLFSASEYRNLLAGRKEGIKTGIRKSYDSVRKAMAGVLCLSYLGLIGFLTYVVLQSIIRYDSPMSVEEIILLLLFSSLLHGTHLRASDHFSGLPGLRRVSAALNRKWPSAAMRPYLLEVGILIATTGIWEGSFIQMGFGWLMLAAIRHYAITFIGAPLGGIIHNVLHALICIPFDLVRHILEWAFGGKKELMKLKDWNPMVLIKPVLILTGLGGVVAIHLHYYGWSHSGTVLGFYDQVLLMDQQIIDQLWRVVGVSLWRLNLFTVPMIFLLMHALKKTGWSQCYTVCWYLLFLAFFYTFIKIGGGMTGLLRNSVYAFHASILNGLLLLFVYIKVMAVWLINRPGRLSAGGMS